MSSLGNITWNNALGNIIWNNSDKSLWAYIPNRQLLHRSIQLIANGSSFQQWSEEDHQNSCLFMQRIARIWQENNLTNQYLIYGKIDTNTFCWEMVPYQKCHTFLGRTLQQIQVLWRTIFGGIAVSIASKETQAEYYQSLLDQNDGSIFSQIDSNKGSDSFCNDDIIERQMVIKGEKVNVLFNYAPIGFGGERLHFLVVPKKHRETFEEITKDEYCESLALTKRLVNHFEGKKCVYLLNKTGIDAGQTVKHWHLHVIFATNSAQDFWGKLTVFKNILIGSSPMKNEDLIRRVNELKEQLNRN